MAPATTFPSTVSTWAELVTLDGRALHDALIGLLVQRHTSVFTLLLAAFRAPVRPTIRIQCAPLLFNSTLSYHQFPDANRTLVDGRRIVAVELRTDDEANVVAYAIPIASFFGFDDDDAMLAHVADMEQMYADQFRGGLVVA